MEEKLDELMAMLASRQKGEEASPSESSPAPSQPTKSLSRPDTDSQAFSHPFASSVSSLSSSRADNLKAQQPLPIFSFPNFDPFNDVISKGILDFGQAEQSVRFFQSKSSDFPFVLVPSKMTLDSLRREKPFLLLSILSFAAFSNEKLQLRLELELRESLSKRLIVHSEKSLDLLQGVMVYLAWYESPVQKRYIQLTSLSGIISTLSLTENKFINFHKWLQRWSSILG
jgi:hypothetical protein